MTKFIVLVICLSVAGTGFFAFANQGKLGSLFATNIAFLECRWVSHSSASASWDTNDAMERFGFLSYSRLRRDWIDDRIILDTVDMQGNSVDGLHEPLIMRETALNYVRKTLFSNYGWSLNRQTLELKWNRSSNNFTAQCYQIPKSKFNEYRKLFAKQGKNKQKI